MSSPEPDNKVLIIGAGCFGLSTAYHLLKRGFKDVTIIDRAEVLPASDAASTDVNKVVRSSYSDLFYTQLARDAIRKWKDEQEWGTNYHESGVVVCGSESTAYTEKSYTNDAAVGCRLQKLESQDATHSVFPPGIRLGSSFQTRAVSYLNRDGGWVHSAGGIIQGMKNVTALGGKIIPGKPVKALLRSGDKTTGVECTDGTVFNADIVVIATGSWTPSAFAGLGLDNNFTATGQSVAMIQLTPEEAVRYRDVPIILDQATGFYVFPPNSDNIVKMAIHDSGHTSKTGPTNISTPRTAQSHGEQEGLRIPRAKVQALRNYLRGYYPELAETKPFIKTRLCWYCDTIDGDWIIGSHPTDKSLVFATGGSGHAYKFFPVIGRLVADLIQGNLSDELVHKFAVNRSLPSVPVADTDFRQIQPPELDEDELCTPEDLLP